MNLTTLQHRWIYLAALAMIAVGLPFSKPVISIGEIVLVVNFIWEGNWKQRWNALKAEPTVWLFAAVFAMHLLGLAWTTDMKYGLNDVRIKIPLLLFPVIIALSHRLRRSEFLWIAALFTASVIVSSFISLFIYWQIKDDPSANFRDISLFNSHIRYALMVCLGYLILLNCAWNEPKRRWMRLAYIILAIWLSVFIFILQSMTGILVWLACGYMLLFYTLLHTKTNWVRWSGYAVLISVPLILMSYLLVQLDSFYPDKRPDFSKLEATTAEGEYYSHDTTNLSLENGNYINLYIAMDEMKREWNLRSQIPFTGGRDQKSQWVYSTLIRYLTSKGLKKDAVGVRALTDADIKAIESGIANHRFLKGNPIDNRVYTVIWEFDRMVQEKRVQGHSVTQRLEFWKAGQAIFKEHFIAGVGTGDLISAYRDMYDVLGSDLTQEHRLKSHNQYLSIGIAFGVFGLILFLISAALPFFLHSNANSFLYIGFCIILYLSMLNEDTLETQAGVTLYAFFNALFLYSLKALSPDDEAMTSL